jgi:pimeloyl-ACP methyl ester carboxylesterase
MTIKTLSRRAAAKLALLLALLVALLAVPFAAGTAGGSPSKASEPKPTIVLVHGAWADSSGWNDSIKRLQNEGYTALAVANPLRSLHGDAAYLSSVLASITGPIVLVGHSYGGMVLTNAATGNPNVKALVYIAAFAPDQGEKQIDLILKNPGSQIGPDTLTFRPYPGGLDSYITPSVFHRVFAHDVPPNTAAVMAATQRPFDIAILEELSGPPAWKTIPSWYLVATEDRAIPPATQRFMANRAGATIAEVRSSHVPMVSRPSAVTDLILDAARATD